MAQSAQDISKQQTAGELAVYESLALKGDISGLKPAEKVRYYADYCHSLGLNPATQPLIPLTLNGKQTFYVAKGATDQLARIHKVNREVISREPFQDVFIVTVRATLPDGRSEDSIGAVAIGGLKGDALSNALMKAETKSKRRATLSILGLGLLDESELETIPQKALAAPVQAVEEDADRITTEQRRRLVALIRDLNSFGFKNEDLQLKMADVCDGVKNSNDLTPAQAEDYIAALAVWVGQLEDAAATAAADAKGDGEPKKSEVPF